MARGPRRPARTLRAALLALAALACSGAEPTRPDVVLFVLDAARVDHFGCYGYPRDTTPHIDAFAREATRYTSAISEASFTFASMAALFSGAPPQRTGLLSPRPVPAEVDLLGEVARAAGYRTWAYSENPFVSEPYGFDPGFDSFTATPLPPNPREAPDPRRGIEAALTWLDTPSAGPRLLFVHLLRPHNPYVPLPEYVGRFGSSGSAAGATVTLLGLDHRRTRLDAARTAEIVALYDENLASADAAFGALLEGLRERDLLEPSLVIVVSDHGEAFGEHDRWLHSTTTHEEMIRIPLLVRLPGGSAGVVSGPVQLADLGTALRALLGGAHPEAAFGALGRDPQAATLSWTMRSAARVALRTPALKLVADSRSYRPIARYDLERDPGEQSPLAPGARGGPQLRLLRARLADGPLAEGVASAPGPEWPLREPLEALGYVEPSAPRAHSRPSAGGSAAGDAPASR